MNLARVHRQSADNPILDLAHALADPALEFHHFEQMIEEISKRMTAWYGASGLKSI